MSKTYVTRPGDTFSSISRAEMGSERYAQLIKQANPGASTPFRPGTSLQLPGGDTRAGFKPFGLDVRIDGTSIAVYESFTHTSAADGFSRIEFTIPNEIETRALVPMLTPTAVDVGYNGQQLFSGYVETPEPDSTDTGKSLKITASSWANVISGPVPITTFPVEFKSAGLDVIAKTLIDPFLIEHVFQCEPGPVFSKVSMKQTDNAFDFLSGLCKQRAMVMRDDEFGSVVFDDGSSIGAPVLKIEDIKRPDCVFNPSVDASQWFSHITGILTGKNKKRKKKIVWQNPFYTGIMRNHDVEFSDIDEGELETAVNSVAARMFASVWSMEITMAGWTDSTGNIIRSGALVEAKSESNYLPKMTELMIDSVTLNGPHDAMLTTFNCVIPGCYAGIIPESVPWK